MSGNKEKFSAIVDSEVSKIVIANNQKLEICGSGDVPISVANNGILSYGVYQNVFRENVCNCVVQRKFK